MTTAYASRRRQRGPERHEREAARMEAQREREIAKRLRREERLFPLLRKTEAASKAWEKMQERLTVIATKTLVCRGEAENALVLGVPSTPFGVDYVSKRYGAGLGSLVREVSDFRGLYLICDVEAEEGDGCH